ncbi:transposon protein, putative, Mutator sub-class [Panicum miliaceum]|uniref:Transposon protein, putative, Mutator sub-class n=1 Tax=Panicum miliaceum TaxID=4540 RepID=A0A3L6RA72_PANMI|nr:transposon protein, putative, Mutator sub-class [Panicum miliaceum]
MSKQPVTDENPGVTPGLPPLGQGLDDPNIHAEPKEKWALLFDTLGERMELLNDSLDQWHRAYAHITEGNDGVPILRARAPKKARAVHPQWVPRVSYTSKKWTLPLQQLERIVEDFMPYQLARHLKAYLLWLFGWVIFTSSHGETVAARWIPYARAIADNDLDEIP